MFSNNSNNAGTTASTADYRTQSTTTTTVTTATSTTTNPTTAPLTAIQQQLARAKALQERKKQLESKPNQIDANIDVVKANQQKSKELEKSIAEKEALIVKQAEAIEETNAETISTTAKINKSIALMQSMLDGKAVNLDNLDEESEETQNCVTQFTTSKRTKTEITKFENDLSLAVTEKLSEKRKRNSFSLTENKKMRDALSKPEPVSIFDTVSTATTPTVRK